jgi:acyl dehydratase
MSSVDGPEAGGGAPVRGLWFEDFEIGQEMVTVGRTICEHDVYTFAGLTGDAYELHTNEEYGRTTIFGSRIVHGMLGLSIMHGLICRTLHVEGTGVAMIGWDRIAFRAPIRFGDTVRTRWRATDKRASASRPGVGVVVEWLELVNQHGTVVVEGEYRSLVRMRPA